MALTAPKGVDMSTPATTISAMALRCHPVGWRTLAPHPAAACGKLRGRRCDSWHGVAMLGPSAPAPFDPSGLRLADALRRSGIEPRRGGWVAVRHGVWIGQSEWLALDPARQHAAFVHATMLVCDPDSEHVVSHSSAAAIWGLPRIESWPPTVHVTTTPGRVRSSARMVRHTARDTPSVQREGLTVTPVARTVADVARTSTLATALASADHALRFGLCTSEALAAELARVSKGMPGRARLSLAVDLADGRSMSPGESLSRAQMYRLNVPRPDLQVRYADAQGLIGDVDFGWDGVVGEFDGRVKYNVPDGASSEEASRILWREKKREDRLRRKVDRVARWTWDVALDHRRLGAVLAQHGIRTQVRNTWVVSPGLQRRAG